MIRFAVGTLDGILNLMNRPHLASLTLLAALLWAGPVKASMFSVDDWAVVFGSDGRFLANTGDDDRLRLAQRFRDSSNGNAAKEVSPFDAAPPGQAADYGLVVLRFDRAHLRPFVPGCQLLPCIPCPQASCETVCCDPPACPPLECEWWGDPAPAQAVTPPANAGGPISLLSQSGWFSTNWMSGSIGGPGAVGGITGLGYGGGGVGGGGGYYRRPGDPNGTNGPGGGDPGIGGPGGGNPGIGGPGGGDPGNGPAPDGPGGNTGGPPGGDGEGPNNETAPEPATLVIWGTLLSAALTRFGFRRATALAHAR